jgi:hypothetical protein
MYQKPGLKNIFLELRDYRFLYTLFLKPLHRFHTNEVRLSKILVIQSIGHLYNRRHEFVLHGMFRVFITGRKRLTMDFEVYMPEDYL